MGFCVFFLVCDGGFFLLDLQKFLQPELLFCIVIPFLLLVMFFSFLLLVLMVFYKCHFYGPDLKLIDLKEGHLSISVMFLKCGGGRVGGETWGRERQINSNSLAKR